MLDEWTCIMLFYFTITSRTWFVIFSSCHKVQHTCNHSIVYNAWWMNLNYVILFCTCRTCYFIFNIHSFYKLLCVMNELVMLFYFTFECRTWLLFSSCHKVQHTCNHSISYYAWWMNLNYVILFCRYMPYMIVIFFMPQSSTYMQSLYNLLCLMNELELCYFILPLHAVHDCYFLFMPQSSTYMQSFYKLLCLMDELELCYFILPLHAVHDCYFLHATKFNIHAIILQVIMLDEWTWIMLFYFAVTCRTWLLFSLHATKFNIHAIIL